MHLTDEKKEKEYRGAQRHSILGHLYVRVSPEIRSYGLSYCVDCVLVINPLSKL